MRKDDFPTLISLNEQGKPAAINWLLLVKGQSCFSRWTFAIAGFMRVFDVRLSVYVSKCEQGSLASFRVTSIGTDSCLFHSVPSFSRIVSRRSTRATPSSMPTSLVAPVHLHPCPRWVVAFNHLAHSSCMFVFDLMLHLMSVFLRVLWRMLVVLLYTEQKTCSSQVGSTPQQSMTASLKARLAPTLQGPPQVRTLVHFLQECSLHRLVALPIPIRE